MAVRASGLVVHEVALVAFDVEGHQRSPHRCGCCHLDPARLVLVPDGGDKPDEVVVCNRLAWNSLPQRRTLVDHAMAVQAQRNTAGLAELLWTSVGSGADHILRAAEQAQGVNTAVWAHPL